LLALASALALIAVACGGSGGGSPKGPEGYGFPVQEFPDVDAPGMGPRDHFLVGQTFDGYLSNPPTNGPHAEVAAAQKHLLRLAGEKRLALFIDLHNPGPSDKQPFFYCCPESTLTELGRSNLDRFLTICRGEMNGRPAPSGDAGRPSHKTTDVPRCLYVPPEPFVLDQNRPCVHRSRENPTRQEDLVTSMAA